MLEAIERLFNFVLSKSIPVIQKHFKIKANNRKNSEYLAIKLIPILDEFVEICVAVVRDDGLIDGHYYASDGNRYAQVSAPKFLIDDLDVDWKTIPTDLMYEILGFPNKIRFANKEIEEIWEFFSSPPDFEEVFEARKIKYSELGLRAIIISNKLRELYLIPSGELNAKDTIRYFSESINRVQLKQKERLANTPRQPLPT